MKNASFGNANQKLPTVILRHFILAVHTFPGTQGGIGLIFQPVGTPVDLLLMEFELLDLSCLTSRMIHTTSELKTLQHESKCPDAVIAGRLDTGIKNVLAPQEDLFQLGVLRIRIQQITKAPQQPAPLFLLLKTHDTLLDRRM